MDAVRYAIYNHNAKPLPMPAPTIGLVKNYPGKPGYSSGSARKIMGGSWTGW